MAAVMLQGTGSDGGKSELVAGLCHLLTNRGMQVLPFKPQSMSNNAAVTPGGGESGRAQALQALACRAPLSFDMSPVLLKPQSDRSAQVVVHGRVQGRVKGRVRGDQDAAVDAALDELAAALERHISVDRMLAIAGQAA